MRLGPLFHPQLLGLEEEAGPVPLPREKCSTHFQRKKGNKDIKKNNIGASTSPTNCEPKNISYYLLGQAQNEPIQSGIVLKSGLKPSRWAGCLELLSPPLLISLTPTVPPKSYFKCRPSRS